MNIQTELRLLLNDPNLVLQAQVQSLWSGYGQIVRCYSPKVNRPYIVKVVAPKNAKDHPRGWNTSNSHQRKLMSYQVESIFYQHYAHLTDANNKVPALIANATNNDITLIVLEDLDHCGYALRKKNSDWQSLKVAIRWLAYFHAKFMECENTYKSKGLWPIGTYWHLSTRQDEWIAMPDSIYKQRAQQVDIRLNNAMYQTLVHGDAKFENLCFNANDGVAAVDFQYIGRGAGVKDLAYLVGSCLNDAQLFELDHLIIEEYLLHLKLALSHYNNNVNIVALERETRELYPVAWADFYRFLLGWNPKSWKIGKYMKQKGDQGIEGINA